MQALCSNAASPAPDNGKQVDGSLKQVDGGDAYVYGVSCIDDIYARPVDGSGSWRQIPGKLKHITASGKSDLFGVNAQGDIFRCTKPCVGEWEKVEGTLSQCDGSFEAIYGVNSGGNIFRRPTGI